MLSHGLPIGQPNLYRNSRHDRSRQVQSSVGSRLANRGFVAMSSLGLYDSLRTLPRGTTVSCFYSRGKFKNTFHFGCRLSDGHKLVRFEDPIWHGTWNVEWEFEQVIWHRKTHNHSNTLFANS